MRCCGVWPVLAAVVLTGVGLGQSKEDRASATNSPARIPAPSATNQPSAAKQTPLLLTDDKPLLLLDDDSGTNAPAVTGADNSRCQVCHLNFMQEVLALSHARTNIGCADCHGPSDAHIADESWASGGKGTPPDILFHWTKIGRACVVCHKTEQLLAVEKHKPNIDAIWFEEKVCTDCHGRHRMVTRRCKWK